MDAITLVDAMLATGWSYDEASHGFVLCALPESAPTLVSSTETLWVSWQQAVDMLEAAEKGHQVEAAEVEPTSKRVAEMFADVANEA